MRTIIIAITLLLTGAAQAAIIDFETEAVGSISSPLVIGDFQFFASGGAIIQEAPGDNALFLQGTGSTSPFGDDAGPLIITMTSVSGSPFALLGADVLGTSLNGTASWGFSGLVAGGAYPLGPFASGPVGTGDWLNLDSVRFEVISTGVVGGFDTLSLTIDNVNVNVVPIPAAVWLFASAIAGLGWFRRRPTT